MITIEPVKANKARIKREIAAVLATLPVPLSRPQVQGIVIASEAYAKAHGLTLAYIYEHTKLYTLCKDAEAECQTIEG